MKVYDTVIVGGGPAGVTASLYLTRAKKTNVVITSGTSGLSISEKIDNYYGFPNGIDGKTLYENGLKQVENLGTEVKRCEVVEIIKNSDCYEVRTSEGVFNGRTLILATGKKKKKPKIKNLEVFEGKGVSYCAICDAFFFRAKDVAVIGNTAFALHELEYLAPIVRNVVLFTNGKKAPEGIPNGIAVDTRPIIELRGNRVLSRIVFANGETRNIEGLFIAEGNASSIDFANTLGIIVEDNNIVINEKQETNVLGVYACGDVVGGVYQITKASHDGMVAALSIISYLKKVKGFLR